MTDDRKNPQLRERWHEGLAKVRRLRNEVAHLWKVSPQDIEGFSRTLDRMRQDIIRDLRKIVDIPVACSFVAEATSGTVTQSSSLSAGVIPARVP